MPLDLDIVAVSPVAAQGSQPDRARVTVLVRDADRDVEWEVSLSVEVRPGDTEHAVFDRAKTTFRQLAVDLAWAADQWAGDPLAR